MARVSVATKASNSTLVVVSMVAMVSLVPVAPILRTIVSTMVPAIVRNHDATAEQRRCGNQQCEKGLHGVSTSVDKCGEAKPAFQLTGTLQKAPALELRRDGLCLGNVPPPVRSMGAAYCFFVLSTLALVAAFAASVCVPGFATSALAFALSESLVASVFAIPASVLAAFILLGL